MMKRLLAALAALLLSAMPVKAASGSITINEPGPYQAWGTVTLSVAWSRLKGNEYPVVLYWCGYTDLGAGGIVKNWFYFRRWDVDPGNPEAGPQPVPLPAEAHPQCTFELWAYGGKLEHVIAVGPTIEVQP